MKPNDPTTFELYAHNAEIVIITLETESITVTLIISITVNWLTDCVILTSIGVAWIKFRFAISSRILGITCTYIVVDEVCAVPINTRVGVALINVTVTVST